MTREGALAHISNNPQDVYIGYTGYKEIVCRIVINGTAMELNQLSEILGGRLLMNARGRRAGELQLVFLGDEAKNLIQELMDRPDFRRSGKYVYAFRMLKEAGA